MNNDINTVTIIDIDNTSPTTVVTYKINTPQHHESVIINNNDDTFTIYPLNSDDARIVTREFLTNFFNNYPAIVDALNTPWSES
jgi:hypothetical protein